MSEEWSGWFDDLVITNDGDDKDSPTTLLMGPVRDQAALRGLLSKIWNLNMTIISVHRLDSNNVTCRGEAVKGI